jgi:hypothetical protein
MALSVSEKPEFSKKVDAQTHDDGWKGCGTTNMPASAQNNIIMDQKNILKQYNYSAQQKNVRTSKYGETQSLLLEWFRQKQALNVPIYLVLG